MRRKLQIFQPWTVLGSKMVHFWSKFKMDQNGSNWAKIMFECHESLFSTLLVTFWVILRQVPLFLRISYCAMLKRCFNKGALVWHKGFNIFLCQLRKKFVNMKGDWHLYKYIESKHIYSYPRQFFTTQNQNKCTIFRVSSWLLWIKANLLIFESISDCSESKQMY